MRLVPPAEDVDVRSHAERRVAGLLTAVCSDDGVAYHSVRLPRRPGQAVGEADFVVLWKGTILVLEVKGGRIGRSGKGPWYSTDRQGNRHALRRSPWVQARDTAHALLDILAHPSAGSRWPFAYAVVTPDQDLIADREGVPHQHIGSERMTPAGMECSLDALARLARTPPDDVDHARRPHLRPLRALPVVLTDLRRDIDTLCPRADAGVLVDRTPAVSGERAGAHDAHQADPRRFRRRRSRRG
ncbi:nuclease-related domain-containing protein [Arthrobacter sp. RIT-PI-e]|uniref:nuclease-related domain-containing protein n=1 Tax=Arthrobacter sp. RIT-PI-e TaxID=1681197 RepID=UPI0006763A8D|nr:nuclease-related domain-containing protein [Arthrobacter sp. RIT-PI-e]